MPDGYVSRSPPLHSRLSKLAVSFDVTEPGPTNSRNSAPHNENFPDADEAHVWVFSLKTGPPENAAEYLCLSEAEHNRLNRFQFERHRRRFRLRRTYLRHVLAGYLDMHPREILYDVDQRGKPSLAQDSRSRPLSFSTSHSEELGVILVTRSSASGVDIEHFSHAIDTDALARQMFCGEEYEAIRSTYGDTKVQRFLNCWTGKEAYLKALGFGLAKPLDSFCVATAVDQSAGLIWDRQSSILASEWHFRRKILFDSYIVTIAHRGPLRSVTQVSPNELRDQILTPLKIHEFS